MSGKSANRNSKHKRLCEEVVLKLLQQKNEAVGTREISQVLGQTGKRGIDETHKILEKLKFQGRIVQVRRNRWVIPDSLKEVIGRVVGHIEGHGFVLPVEGGEKIFLRNHDMNEVLHGDTVRIRIVGKDKRNKRFGQILEVVERANKTIVGRFFVERGLSFVVPNDQRISQDVFIAPDSIKSLKEAKEIEPQSGQVVICKIIQYPTKNFQPVGEVVEVLGDYLAPGMEIEIAKNEFAIPSEWPESIHSETEKLPSEVRGDDFPNRNDIRHLPLVTIDGEDARDFDDAVFCESTDQSGFRLIVAIADVSHYVNPKTQLDSEAWLRGNSVYFPRQVIPMLPEVLSNGLCSLNPGVDRLCMVCEMQIDKSGKLIDFEFYQAVMHSHARLTYTQVADFFNLKEEKANVDPSSLPIVQAPSAVINSLNQLESLAKVLTKNRYKRGSIDLDIAEPVIQFNDDRKIEAIIPRERNFAHRLIEECMLLANICAADALSNSKLAGVYRIHEQPAEEKVEETRQYIQQFGVMLTGGTNPTSLDYSQLINKVAKRDDTQVKIIHQALLRSFKQARYSEENTGHFALAFDSYTHFTSPIRRYSDLHVHRQIKRLIQDPAVMDKDEMFESAAALSEQTSMTERRAEKATRAVIQWLKCEFMSHKVGEKLTGTITSVTDFGLFVELDDFFIEGLIHIANLGDDYYIFNETTRSLQGETSGKTLQAGKKLKVVVSRVDLEQKRIDFDLDQKFRQDKGKKFLKKTKRKDAAKKQRKKNKKGKY